MAVQLQIMRIQKGWLNVKLLVCRTAGVALAEVNAMNINTFFVLLADVENTVKSRANRANSANIKKR